MTESAAKTRFSAGIIGLGKVGSRFDEEKRGSVWSHAGAFIAANDRISLVGGADVGTENRELFQLRCPAAEVFSDPVAFVKDTKPDILSICTPPEKRAELVEAILTAHAPKVLLVEKPIDTLAEGRTRLLAAVEKAGCVALVNYNRRYYPACRAAKRAAWDGTIGEIRTITVRIPNRLWSMGSHAMNLLLFLADAVPVAWQGMPLPLFEETDEPAVDMICRFPNGSAGRLLCEGDRSMLFFESEIMGTEGRIRIDRNGERARLERFQAKQGWAGYRSLEEPVDIETNRPDFSSFVQLVEDACDAVGSDRGSADLESAIAGENLLESLVKLYRQEQAC
ncbi:MAG: Gfo/Idh/MocA family oxidoreductase [Alphaproteobacteria bacterium]